MAKYRFTLQATADQRQIELAGEMTAGHLPECQIRLSPGGATGGPSRRHAQFRVDGTKVWLEDLGSTNGTFVSDQRLAPRVPRELRTGERVRFDREEFTFTAESLEPVSQKTVMRSPTVIGAGGNDFPLFVDDPAGAQNQKNATVFFDVSNEPQTPSAEPPAPQMDVPYLLVASGAQVGKPIPLQATAGSGKAQWNVGSDGDRDIIFAEAGVSGRHAKIVNEGARWKLIDQLATSGTFVNGNRTNMSFLKSGDRVRFGPVECIFCLPSAHSAAASGSSGGNRRVAVLAVVSFLITLAVVLGVWIAVRGMR
jgi:pSer/pThr/pTyr-binding forkhead associated (FHA) protein